MASKIVASFKEDQKKDQLLTSAQSKLYNLRAAGVKGVQCDVELDWPEFFRSLDGSPLPPQTVTMQYLNASHLRLSTDLEDTKLDWQLPPANTLPEARRGNIDKLLSNAKKIVGAFLEAWVPTLNGRLIPVAHTTLTTTATGFVIINNLPAQRNTVTFDRDMRITHIKTVEPTMISELDTVFTTAPEGWLMTSLGGTTQEPPASAPKQILMTSTFTKVGGVEWPTSFSLVTPRVRLTGSFTHCAIRR